MPIHFPIINTNLTKPNIKSTNSQINKEILPLTTAPIGAYYIGENRDNYITKIIKIFNDKDLELPKDMKKAAGGAGLSSSTKLTLMSKYSSLFSAALP